MKIAVPTTGSDLDATMDARFGRASKFIIFDDETKEFEITDNMKNLNAAQGAGIQTAQNIADTGSQVVITGHCGPKAYKALKAAGIKIFSSKPEAVREVLGLYFEGSLKEISAPDVEGHW